jgi:hypothetical protein
MLSAGTRGVVTYARVDAGVPEIQVEVVDARDPAGTRIDSLIGKTFLVFNTDAIEPLVDNWLPFQPKKRYSPASPRKTTSRRVRPNTIPPPPTGQHNLRDWASKTFAPGTAVRLKKTAWATLYGDPTKDFAESAKLPAGTVGRVSHVTYGGRSVQVEGDFHVPMFTSSSIYRFKTDFDYDVVDDYLEPLDDNWGPLVIPSKRTSKKPQPGWQKQLARSRRVRAMRPNATCPSCGSPHYFESMWHRDCATPTCEYFRGGTVTSPESAEHLTTRHHSSAGPTGARQILITYDIVTPESAAEGDYEDSGEEETVHMEASDLDDDETWAEWAAGQIARKLGHVDDNGDGSYYQSEFHTQDYSTGEEKRLAAHLHPPGAWADDLDEIHKLLKRRRLVS